MNIRETGDRMVFQCESEKVKGKWYRVDRLSMSGKGQCSCASWTYRVAANVGRKTGQQRCKHISAVDLWFMDKLCVKLAKTEEAP